MNQHSKPVIEFNQFTMKNDELHADADESSVIFLKKVMPTHNDIALTK